MYAILDLLITLRCNARCANCIELCNSRDRTGLDYSDSDMTLGQIHNLVRQVRELGVAPLFTTVSVTGGEPLLHPQVEQIVSVLRDGILAPGFAQEMRINTNGLLAPPAVLREFCVTYSTVSTKPSEHNVCLLHPADFGGKTHTFDSCPHYRKNRVVLSYQGFSMCCAGDAYIRLFCRDDLILDHLPASVDGFPLREMGESICRHCPFSNDTQNTSSLLPFERDQGSPVSAIYAEQAALNKAGLRIVKRFPEATP